MRFSFGASCSDPVMEGCSVDPYERTSEIPSASARSATALGMGEPPSPTYRMSSTCSGPNPGASSRLVKK